MCNKNNKVAIPGAARTGTVLNTTHGVCEAWVVVESVCISFHCPQRPKNDIRLCLFALVSIFHIPHIQMANYSIPRSIFRRLTKNEIIMDSPTEVENVTQEALDLLQQVSEGFVAQQLGCANVIATAAGRDTLLISDMHASLSIQKAAVVSASS